MQLGVCLNRTRILFVPHHPDCRCGTSPILHKLVDIPRSRGLPRCKRDDHLPRWSSDSFCDWFTKITKFEMKHTFLVVALTYSNSVTLCEILAHGTWQPLVDQSRRIEYITYRQTLCIYNNAIIALSGIVSILPRSCTFYTTRGHLDIKSELAVEMVKANLFCMF